MIKDMDIDFSLGSIGWQDCLSSDLSCDSVEQDIVYIIKNIRHLTPYLEKNFLNHKFRSLEEIYEPKYLRESGHFLGDDLCVYAQVRVSNSCFKNYKERLKDLKDNPIGPTWLFLDNKIKRSNFQFFVLNKSDNNNFCLHKRAQYWKMKSSSTARKSTIIMI